MFPLRHQEKSNALLIYRKRKFYRDNFELTSNCSNVVPLGWGPKQGNSTKFNIQGDALFLRYTYLGGT